MSFSQFRSLGDVIRELEIQVVRKDFVGRVAGIVPEPWFQTRLNSVMEHDLYGSSEAARCETLISPVLQEMWSHYRSEFKLWSHTPIQSTDILYGVPDYLIARKSKYGPPVMGSPILVAIEAKKDDFELGWGQCAAEMRAVQLLNATTKGAVELDEYVVFGIVTNGEIWQFGKLEGNILTQEIAYFGIGDLDALFGALTFVMEECKKQVVAEDFIAA
jgi:hypothetical protein